LALFLENNHPWGVCTPREADMKITRKIKDAGALLELSVLDHKIVAHDACYSFADVFYSNLFRG
jgi:DNA repair protein RadC